jgi:hypothetical protein
MPATTTITVDVDPETAEAYANASDQERKKVRMLLRIGLRPDRSKEALSRIMDKIGAEAEANGMTPEILEDILRNK